MRFIIFVIRLGLFTGLLGLSLIAIAAFLGFALPIFDVFNHFQPIWLTGLVIFMVLALWAFQRGRWRAWTVSIGFTGILASAVIIVPEMVAGLVADPGPSKDAHVYTLMTRNLFGLNYDMQRVQKAIADEDPDIIALQEYFIEQRAELHDLIIGDYPYYVTCEGGKRASLAIYARIPFATDDGSLCPDNYYQEGNRIGWLVARFSPPGEPAFSVMTTHLNWPVQISPLLSSDAGSWTDKIAAMTARKSTEYAELLGAVKAVDGPLMLVGDFNSTPWSYGLRHFATQAGLERHNHSLFTFPEELYFRRYIKTIPFLPLDHVMTRGVNVHDLQVADPAGSDHKALLARFSVPASAPNP